MKRLLFCFVNGNGLQLAALRGREGMAIGLGVPAKGTRLGFGRGEVGKWVSLKEIRTFKQEPSLKILRSYFQINS